MSRNVYTRKSFTVLAEEVTFENVHEVAEWCKGTVVMENTKLMGTETKLPVILLKGQGDNRGKEFKATLGCYVVELKGSFRVYKNQQFFSSFEERIVVDPEPSEEFLKATILDETVPDADYFDGSKTSFVPIDNQQ